MKNSTRILLSLSGFIAATLILLGAIVGVHSIHQTKQALTNVYAEQLCSVAATSSIDLIHIKSKLKIAN